MKMIYLVGTTSHKHQYPPCPEFDAFLRHVCNDKQAKAIAEEMNVDEIDLKSKAEGRSITKSVPKQVADSLELPHRYCDPGKVRRDELGIDDLQTVNALLDFGCLSPVEAEAAHRKRNDQRELEWLNIVALMAENPVLFVCGADHIQTFPHLLARNSYHFEIVEAKWTLTTQRQ